MTHLLHLVRADLRRFRILLALWVLVAIGEAVFRVIRPAFGGEPQVSMMFDLLAAVLSATRWLGMWVIVALVVQAHPLVGSDAFWMTRPISSRLLLASRLVLLLATFAAFPALVELVLMVACRVPLADALAVAVEVIMFQCLWLFIFMALSSLTKNLARLALAAGCVLIGLILLFNLMIAVMMRRMDSGPQMVDVIPRMEANPTGLIVTLFLGILAILALVAVQYHTRSVRRSLLAGVAGICVAVAAAFLWPSPGRPLPVPDWATRDSAVRLVAESPRGEFRPLEHGSFWDRRREGWQLGVALLRIAGVEEGWLPTVKLKDASIGFGDGTTVPTAGNGFSTQLVLMPADGSISDGPHTVVARQALGVGRLLEGAPFPQAERGTTAIILTEEEFRKRLGSQGTYRGTFLVDLDRFTAAAALPLQPGATYQAPHRRVILDDVVAQSRAALIRLRHVASTSIFDSATQPELSFYLRNRSTSEAVAGSVHGMFGASSGIGMPMLFGVSSPSEGGTGFSVTTQVIRFPTYDAYAGPARAVDITPEWLSHAELVVVHKIPAGSVPRSIEITHFEIAAAPPRPPG